MEEAKADDVLGVALLEGGRSREAIDKLEAALVKQPDNPDLLYYLSQAHARLAKQAFDVLSERSPLRREHDRCWVNRERRVEIVRRRKRTFALPWQCVSDLRGVHFALGELYLGSGDYENAEREFRKEAQMAPGSAPAAFKLGVVLMNRGEVCSALAEMQRANALQPDMPETLLEFGKASAAAGEVDLAEKLFRRTIELEQASRLAESAHFQLAQIYRRLGRPADSDREMKVFQEMRKSQK